MGQFTVNDGLIDQNDELNLDSSSSIDITYSEYIAKQKEQKKAR